VTGAGLGGVPHDKSWGGLLAVATTVLAIAAGCGAPSRSPSAPAPAAGREATPVAAAPELPLSDEGPEPVVPGSAAGPQVTLKLVADAKFKAHVFWGRKDLGVAPLEIRRPRGSGPLDLLLVAPGFLPLHTRAFTDHDETLSVRLYDEEAANGLLGHPRAEQQGGKSEKIDSTHAR
jgi:hypothetical protein